MEPKGLAVFAVGKGEELKAEPVEGAKPELLNAGVFGANRLEGVEDEKGFADDDCPNEGVGVAENGLTKPGAAVA